MSVVVPKLLYSEKKAGDIPVWEITTKNGEKIYYEREDHPGYRPIGNIESFNLGSSRVSVFDVACPPKGVPLTVLSAKQGYVAPLNWYVKVTDKNENVEYIEECDEI